ncbi:MAG: enoyl-CoA hydratase [Acidobacteria bacterium]|nr:enoyl-CoA hydratase [Acidobacteriota bacterium]MSO61351.1 enoyl-CoA hydratase [Acidobacteriota bacterium]
MPSSNLVWDINGSVGVVTFNRPEARNALTWDMYDALVAACETAEATGDVRVLIIRGAGGAFAAGTDISQFREFANGDAGVAYERRLDAVIDRIERLGIPTIAEVDGAAVGGGCAIAMACDLRMCSERARFGVPVSRTLGNCLSMANTARMVDLLGLSATRDLLLTGRLIDANEAYARGVAHVVLPVDELEAATIKVAVELSTRAPSTIKATKAMLLRLRDHRRPPAGSADDILRACYGSADFKEGVAAFLERRKPRFWA